MKVNDEPKFHVFWNVTKFERSIIADVMEGVISASASFSTRRGVTLTWLFYCAEENIRFFRNVSLCEKTWILNNAAVNHTSCTGKFVLVQTIKA